MRLALAVASCTILIVHGIVFYKQFFHRWERNQTAYFDQARAQARSEAERRELAERRPRVEQIIVTQFGDSRVDRCPTCHVAADDPRFADHFQPLRTHSYSEALGDRRVNGHWERRHKFSDFGCTICHDGQGRGLEPFYSHGEDEYWPQPMLGYVTQATWKRQYVPGLLGALYIEASCVQCHTGEEFAGAPHVARGRRLFFDKNCYGCHRIEGMSEGTLGPDLTEVGNKFKVDYLWESIVDPRANIATSFMPKFNLSVDEVTSLVVFLKSRRGKNFGETSLDRYRARLGPEGINPLPAPEPPPVEPVEWGGRLVRERACAACHKIGEQDGVISPDLSFEGLIREERWLTEHFHNPRSVVPDSIMPSFRFSDGEFRAMAAYLASLRTPPPLMTPAESYRALCLRCHGAQGNGAGPIAPYLDPAPRDFTKSAFMNSKQRSRLLASIRDGVPGTSMPGWGKVLDDARRSELLDYIFATYVGGARKEPKVRNVPETNPVPTSAESVARGGQEFMRRCTGCHGVKADGKGPNSLDILPRPRNLRNRPFVAGTPDRRLLESILYGVQGTAMPPWIDYGLTTSDAGDIVNYIRSINPRR